MKLILVITATLVLSSCGIERVVEQADAEPANDSFEFTYCGISGPGIAEDTSLSSYQPTNDVEYCDGFRYGYDYVRFEDRSICDEFWDLADGDIIDYFTSGTDATTFSEAVGMVDAMWTVC